MKKYRYLKEGLKAGLTNEDLEIIEIMEDYDKSDFDGLCLQLDLLDDFEIRRIVKRQRSDNNVARGMA